VRPAAALAVLGLALAVGAPTTWALTRPEAAAGAPVAEVLAPPPVPSSEPAVRPAVPTRPAAPAPSEQSPAPVRLAVPALGVDTAVDAVGVEADGRMILPADVDRVGWYRFGPGLSADQGSIVIAGHVDSAEQGKGAFFRLGSMRPGDRITLTGASGSKQFKVVGRERYAKTKIPLDKYFARDGALRLTLITCGGPFDSKTGHYRDNVVVTATPV
jgi:sortase (surface protein transpeptidase)